MQKATGYFSGSPETKNGATLVIEAVTEIHKALKAGGFYPEGHPLRQEIVNRAYQVLISVIGNTDLSLLVTRQGLAPAAGPPPLPATPAVKSLARELFAREIKQISFMPPLSLPEFTAFLTVLTVDPQKIVSDGGIARHLSERSIINILINEIDISAVFTRTGTTEGESAEEYPETDTVLVETFDFENTPPDGMEELELDEIIEAMKKEPGEGRYRRLAGVLLSKVREMSDEGRFNEIIPVSLFLVRESSQSSRSEAQRECAGAAVREVGNGEFTLYLLRLVQDRDCESRESIYLILKHIGEGAVGPAIQMLNAAGNIHARKALTTVLIKIGNPAVPSLLASLKDHRWFVVRSMLTILGEIRCFECLKEVRHTIFHEDERVRKEAIRCLTKLGGPTVTEILLELLRDKNPSIQKQAAFSLGLLKDEKAVDPLLAVIKKWDLFLKTLALKKEAVQSLGLIGARSALPRLVKIVSRSFFFAPRRWRELKVCAIEAIGRIGDQSCVEFLKKTSSRGGPIGEACIRVLRSLEDR